MTRLIRVVADRCDELLNTQAGVIARWQMTAMGSEPRLLEGLLRVHPWQVLYRGVYGAFSGQPPRASVMWAAVLLGGPSAILSYHSAAELDGLTDAPAPAIHITIPQAERRAGARGQHDPSDPRAVLMPRVVVHRSRRASAAVHPSRLPPRTRIEETTLDLAELSGSADDAIAWLSRACGRRLTTAARLAAALRERPRCKWRTAVIAALGDIGAGAQSILEIRYVRDVERPHRLPTALRQVEIILQSRTRYLDNFYEEYGVGVELDGQAAHRTEDRWRDIRRDNALAGSGIVILRYSWADVTERPCQVATEIARALRARGWTGCLARCPSCPPHRPSADRLTIGPPQATIMWTYDAKGTG